MLHLPLEFGELTMDGLVDSGAFINAMSWSDYNAIKMNSDNSVIKENPQPPFKIECANAQLEQPIATADIQFNIGTYTFTDTSVILSKTSFPIIGLNFMRNHQAVIDTANGTITFPHVEMTLAMTDEKKNCNPKPLQIMAEGNQTLIPQQTTTVNAIVITTNAIDITGTVQPLPQFDETATIIVEPALATAHNKRINLRIANLTDFPHTIKNHTKLAELQILKPEDTKQIRPIDVATLTTLRDPDDTHMYVNELMKSTNNEQNDENLWFPTPENPGNEDEHTRIQRRILKEIRELIKKEQLDPTKDPESRKMFLDMFKWEGSQIEGNDKKQLEQAIVEYNNIFARHRLDIGINDSFKVKLTPKDERPIYTQSLPVPINLKEDLTVELALMHRYGIITTLPFSKYASPIFAQRKPNGKLRLLVDLRKINALISDDYINNNHPVSSLSDAAQHLAGKKLFCKLDCSQAYHCLQMADQRSIEMLAFNFASRTFAYKRLAQGLSRVLSAFSSFITTNAIDITGTVQPLPQFDETATIIVALALATAHNKRINLRIANLTDFLHTIKNHTKLAELQILKPEDTKQIRPIDVATLTTLRDPDDTHMYVNELMKSTNNEQNDENLWFPTPENPGNEDEHTPIQRRILKEIRELIKKEQLDPTKDPQSRKMFDMFKWEGSQIEGNDKKQLEQTVVEYNDIFARHRLDIGINNSFKVKLTPKDERPIYTQSLPVPINLKEDLTVELALCIGMA